MSAPIRVLVWNENFHETMQQHVKELYPEGIHGAVAAGIRENLGDAVVVETAVLTDPEHGLTEERLAQTDVLLWWGHAKHDDVSDEVVARVHRHVLAGMGLIVLHSGHFSKPFISLMGTTCSLQWRSVGERELVWTVAPNHPITRGVPSPLPLAAHEMYGEFFDVPTPDELIFISSFEGGEAFRSGMTFRRGRGRIFYFSPGDQEYPIYHDASIRRVIANAVGWAAGDARDPRAVPEVRHATVKAWDV
ncbi:ThuA domain-containing protein [Rugosimonospora africana]|uniref:Trehalose utilization protein ThuA n=1 Tax=Rugosimonospora africana TaxID=556532 RepID=A0A8J3QXT3_9ACTN|nr:ThuA domain-containing protein [Rugosimonospora africana]GIH19380.1 trehalose utilization protein ThuA [Rugosimonospora africana]